MIERNDLVFLSIKKFLNENHYKIYIYENKFFKKPNYIKIDVDGIEHLILNGAKDLLKNKKLQEIKKKIEG